MSDDSSKPSADQVGIVIGLGRIQLPQLAIGAFVMLAGIVLALDVFGVMQARTVFRFWPVVFIAIGVSYTVQRPPNRVGGLIWLGFGSYLLLITLGILPRWTWRLFWPFVLIATGVAIVAQTMRSGGPVWGAGGPSDGTERIRMVGVLGGSNRTSNANPFRGADLIAFMGGGRLDLRHAIIAPGEAAVIDVVAVMGGYEILVPEEWLVDDRTIAVLGGNSNETRPPSGAAPSLIIRGLAVMGGIGIKN